MYKLVIHTFFFAWKVARTFVFKSYNPLPAFLKAKWFARGGGDTPYNGLYGEAPPERGTFFMLQVYKRVGISQVDVYKKE